MASTNNIWASDAHLLVSTLATWARLSSSTALSMAMVVVVVVVVDVVCLTGVVIFLERVGGGGVVGGVVGSFATILPGGILLEEQHVGTVKDHCRKSPSGIVVDEDEEDGGW